MIVKAIQNCIQRAHAKKWPKTYWAFDVHGTILKPTFRPGVLSTEFYPWAKETMQIISQRSDIVMILYTCSHPDEATQYKTYFETFGIHFHYVNENPEISEGEYGHYGRKFYFNVLFEDKAGFDPLTDWEEVYYIIL